MNYTLIMDFENSYMNFKPSYKDYYIKNNYIDEKTITSEDLFSMILHDIDLIFSYLKISPNRVGYYYWKDAILITIFSEKTHLKICNDIYPLIAQKYNRSKISIERAMRLSFETAMYDSCKENNYIVSFLRRYLVNPRNSQLLMKFVELVTSIEFRRFKKAQEI